mmetsp:Transcript_1554/g.1869  ORF Transcript_1554/g.1869 Transcript_1554/m.1869 type:complete len:126 (+) Transcript_1554:194-571(+)
MNILGSLRQRSVLQQTGAEKKENQSNARKALTNATVNELSKLVSASVDDIGVLARNAIDRNDLNESLLTVVSTEPLVLKTDKLLESMESQLILANKALDDGHTSGQVLGDLCEQLSNTREKIMQD